MMKLIVRELYRPIQAMIDFFKQTRGRRVMMYYTLNLDAQQNKGRQNPHF